MSEIENYDVLIVGGGKAGKTLAADLGRSNNCVVLVERGMIGGTCVNVGCIPSKAMVKAAKVAEITAHAGKFGVSVGNRKIDMPTVIAHKRAVVAGMVEWNRKKLANVLGDRFILGEARFVAPRTVEVCPAGGGARPVVTREKNVYQSRCQTRDAGASRAYRG